MTAGAAGLSSGRRLPAAQRRCTKLTRNTCIMRFRRAVVFVIAGGSRCCPSLISYRVNMLFITEKRNDRAGGVYNAGEEQSNERNQHTSSLAGQKVSRRT